MITTFFIGFFVILLAYLNGKGLFKYGLEISFLLLTIFLAIRYDWGNDYTGYLAMFKDYNSGNLGLFDFSAFSQLRKGEEGWVFLCRLFKPIGFFGMVIVLTVFENAVIYRLIKKYVFPKWYWLAVFVFVFNPALMLTGASMMRQYLAMCLYIIAVEFILHKKVPYFILMILIASRIHSSALILLLTLPIFYIKGNNIKKFSPKVFIFLSVVYLIWQFYGSIIFEKSLGSILNIDVFAKYSHYAENSSTSESMGLGVLLYHFLFLNALYLVFKLKSTFRPIYYLFLISFLFGPLVEIVPLIGRINFYFLLFGIICYPILLSVIKNKNYKLLILSSLIILFFKTFWGFFYSEVWVDHFYVYKTIFEAKGWM